MQNDQYEIDDKKRVRVCVCLGPREFPSISGYEFLECDCPGYELSHERVVLGTSCPGYELSFVRRTSKVNQAVNDLFFTAFK